MKKATERVTICIEPEVVKAADSPCAETDCSSRNEFIERAIKFYIGHLSAKHTGEYAEQTILPQFKNMIEASEYKISRELYKLAIEVDMLGRVVSMYDGLSPDNLRLLRYECEADVKRMYGAIKLEDHVAYLHRET